VNKPLASAEDERRRAKTETETETERACSRRSSSALMLIRVLQPPDQLADESGEVGLERLVVAAEKDGSSPGPRRESREVIVQIADGSRRVRVVEEWAKARSHRVDTSAKVAQDVVEVVGVLVLVTAAESERLEHHECTRPADRQQPAGCLSPARHRHSLAVAKGESQAGRHDSLEISIDDEIAGCLTRFARRRQEIDDRPAAAALPAVPARLAVSVLPRLEALIPQPRRQTMEVGSVGQTDLQPDVQIQRAHVALEAATVGIDEQRGHEPAHDDEIVQQLTSSRGQVQACRPNGQESIGGVFGGRGRLGHGLPQCR